MCRVESKFKNECRVKISYCINVSITLREGVETM